MADIQEKLYDKWTKRNPRFEIRHEEAVIRRLADYGVGATELTEAKGKLFGGGYEVFILAFFIGLYSNKRMRLSEDNKTFGQPIMYWGNLDSKKGRKAYPKIREYIFAALVAKTDIDLLELDKGNIAPNKVIDALMLTMNEYANYGFYLIDEKLQQNPNYFFNQQAFFDLIWGLTQRQNNDTENAEEGEEVW